MSSASAPAYCVGVRPGPDDLTRAMRSARAQVAGWQPGLTVALTLAGLLPPYTSRWLRIRLLRAGGLTIGEHTGIGGRLWVAGGPQPGSRLQIGARCFLNDACRFDVSAPVVIGDNVYLGHDVAVLTASHKMGDRWQRAGSIVAEPISIRARGVARRPRHHPRWRDDRRGSSRCRRRSRHPVSPTEHVGRRRSRGADPRAGSVTSAPPGRVEEPLCYRETAIRGLGREGREIGGISC